MKSIKKHIISILVISLAAITFISLSACDKKDPEPSDGSSSLSESKTDAPSEVPTEPESESTSETMSESTSESTSETISEEPVESETEAPEPPKPQEGILEVTWLSGYVGSSTNASGYQNKINHSATFASTYSYTEVITIPKAGTKIWFTDPVSPFASTNAYSFSSWKLVDGKWVIDLDGANYPGGDKAITSDSGSGKTYTYITSKDNENLRLCYCSTVKGDEWKKLAQPTVYYLENAGSGTAEEAAKIEKERAEWLEAQRKKYYNSALDKITMYALGDSYFGGSALGPTLVWPTLLAKKYNMTYTNYGVGGTLMAQKDGKTNFITDRWQQMSAASANIILVNGGRNDYNNNVPIGVDNDTSLKTFKGALNNLIDNLKKKYPNAMLVFVAPWNFSGTNNLGLRSNDYRDAMKKICELKGVCFFDAHDPELSHVDMTSEAFRKEYCLASSDVSHLNEAGHRLVLEYFERFIADEYVKFLAAK